MAARTYNRGRCKFCPRWISNAGGAQEKHMEAHERRGEVVKHCGRQLDPATLDIDDLPYGYVKRFAPELLRS